MPSVTTTYDIFEAARATFLNDTAATKYPDERLLFLAKRAYNYFQSRLESNGVNVKSKEVTKTITAGETYYSPLPNDLVVPVKCEERQAGTSDEFQPVIYRMNIPITTPASCILYWGWRMDRLVFNEADNDREVKLYYMRTFPELFGIDTRVFALGEEFLIAKISALAHLFISQNEERAKIANEIAEAELDEILNILVKMDQANPIRRKPYIPFRR